MTVRGVWVQAGSGEYYTGEDHQFVLPKHWRAGSTTRCLVFCHGADGTAGSWRTFVPELWSFARAGVPCISADLRGSVGLPFQAWGNDSSQSKITSAWDFAKSELGCATDKMVLWGTSMGALTSLNYLRANPTKVAAWAGDVPVLDLDDVHDQNRGGYAANIESAYGGLASYNTAETAHNPNKHTATYAGLGLPLKLWAADADAICPYSIAQSWAAATGAALATISGGHEAGLGDLADEAVSFVAAYV